MSVSAGQGGSENLWRPICLLHINKSQEVCGVRWFYKRRGRRTMQKIWDEFHRS